ncbi:hypothetical protein DM860_002155 [Cuscuta australis]|uniref:inorganic diphosphatase n=1 Tax=Cuscuta australis TaxID=267555 RepID=A0A328DVW9_9ASTE|nr:hypothetical protein DM860_002155 [Cuscuta australis]
MGTGTGTEVGGTGGWYRYRSRIICVQVDKPVNNHTRTCSRESNDDPVGLGLTSDYCAQDHGEEPVLPSTFLRARAIGLMHMIDQGERDDKIITVCADDPEFRHYNDIKELPPHRLAEIRRLNIYVCVCV